MGSNQDHLKEIFSNLISDIIQNDRSTVEMILNQNIEIINYQDKTGDTALMYAISHKHIKIAEFILEQAKFKEILNINLANCKGETALMFAVFFTPSLIEVIIKNYPKVDLNARDSTEFTALIYAAKNNRLDAVKAILASSKTEVDLVDKNCKCTALLWAVHRRNPDMVKAIVDYSIENNKSLNINAQNIDGMTALMLATDLSQKNNTKPAETYEDYLNKSCTIVKTLLRVPGINLGLTSDALGKATALMYIVIYGNLEMLQAFLEAAGEKNYDPEIINAQDELGCTALMYAAYNKKYPTMLEELLKVPCIDLKIKDKEGQNVNVYALEGKKLNILEDFMRKQDIKEKEILVKENREVISKLSESDNDTNVAKIYNTQSEISSKKVLKYVGSIKKLIVALNQGYSENSNYMDVINASDPNDYFKYLHPSKKDSIQIKDLIKQRYQFCGAMIDKPREMIRLKNEDKTKLEEILGLNIIYSDLPAKIPTFLTKFHNKPDNDKRSSYSKKDLFDNIRANQNNLKEIFLSLKNAIMENDRSTVEMILNQNIEIINYQDETGDTALMYAISHKHIKIAAYILEQEKFKEILNINLANCKGETALMFAVGFTPSLIEVIIKNYPKVDLNARDSNEFTALIYAAENNKLDAVKAILASSKTEVDLVDKEYKCTALLWAVYRRNPDMVKAIVDFYIENNKTLSINAQNIDGMTALMLATDLEGNNTKKNLQKSCTIVKTLLRVPGINLGLTSDASGKATALMYIAIYGNLEMLQAFLEAAGGKNSDSKIINAQDKLGCTALMYAAANNKDPAMFKELLKVPCIDLKIKDKADQTVNVYARKGNKLNILEDFMSKQDIKEKGILVTEDMEVISIPSESDKDEAISILSQSDKDEAISILSQSDNNSVIEKSSKFFEIGKDKDMGKDKDIYMNNDMDMDIDVTKNSILSENYNDSDVEKSYRFSEIYKDEFVSIIPKSDNNSDVAKNSIFFEMDKDKDKYVSKSSKFFEIYKDESVSIIPKSDNDSDVAKSSKISESDNDSDVAKSSNTQDGISSIKALKYYVGSIKKLILALNQRYSESSNYMDVINASDPITYRKSLHPSKKESIQIKELIEKRYQCYGAMSKTEEMKNLKKEDQKKLEYILGLNIIYSDDLSAKNSLILTKYSNKPSKKKRSGYFSEGYKSDNSEDEDYKPRSNKQKRKKCG